MPVWLRWDGSLAFSYTLACWKLVRDYIAKHIPYCNSNKRLSIQLYRRRSTV